MSLELHYRRRRRLDKMCLLLHEDAIVLIVRDNGEDSRQGPSTRLQEGEACESIGCLVTGDKGKALPATLYSSANWMGISETFLDDKRRIAC